MRSKKSDVAKRPEVVAMNSLSQSVTKLQNLCRTVWEVIHQDGNALTVTRFLDQLSEAMAEVQDKIDEVKEMHTVNVRQRALSLTDKFRQEHGIPSQASKRKRLV